MKKTVVQQRSFKLIIIRPDIDIYLYREFPAYSGLIIYLFKFMMLTPMSIVLTRHTYGLRE